MRLPDGRHLTYCLNVHPGESADDVLRAIETHAAAVRRQVLPDQPFGLGLRLSAQAAAEFAQPGRLDDLRRALDRHQFYVFTLNGFPYGRFHGERVKENVYQPDWRSPERLAYTLQLAHLLSALLPPGIAGSISTVPVGYRAALPPGADTERAVARALTACALALRELHETSGKEIHLGLEPEPDCWLETTLETARFLCQTLPRLSGEEAVVRQYIGVCVDTCHAAMQFEDVTESLIAYRLAGVRLSKVQLSAALTARAPGPLQAFAEPVYLHQTRLRDRDGVIHRWPDLPAALAADWPPNAEARVHFHVPLFWGGDEERGTTARFLDDSFWRTLQSVDCDHLEIETYTFDVLPPELRAATVAGSIAREYAAVRSAYSISRPATSA